MKLKVFLLDLFKELYINDWDYCFNIFMCFCYIGSHTSRIEEHLGCDHSDSQYHLKLHLTLQDCAGYHSLKFLFALLFYWNKQTKSQKLKNKVLYPCINLEKYLWKKCIMCVTEAKTMRIYLKKWVKDS